MATPIGNLGDISPRALSVLGSVSVVAAEDTRHTGNLLRHFGISTPLISYHRHNERRRREELLALLAGSDVALVSDAGTPGISDPGRDLVDAALAAGLVVSPVPGPSALAAAAGASGLVAGPFVFGGFLPRKRGERDELLGRLAAAGLPLLLFEAPNRLASTLDDLARRFGDREAAVLRELTKMHEEIRRDTLPMLAAWARSGTPRGEIVVVVGAPAQPPRPGDDISDDDLAEQLAALRACGRSASEAARMVAALSGRPRSDLYRLATRTGGGASVADPEGSVRLEGELPMMHEDALKDALGDQKGPKRGQA